MTSQERQDQLLSTYYVPGAGHRGDSGMDIALKTVAIWRGDKEQWRGREQTPSWWEGRGWERRRCWE